MTTAAIHASSLASEVTTNITSPWTVTEHTLNLLRALLGHDREQKGIKAAPKRSTTVKQTKQAFSTSTSRTRAAANKRNNSDQTCQASVSDDRSIDPLHSIAARRLATHVFNASTKCLTDLAKEKLKDETAPNTNRSPESQPDQHGESVLLKQRLPNRQSKKPPSETTSRKHNVEIELVADCAIVSLQYLHGAGTAADEAITSQHDQGRLTLLDRLITLNLVTKAKVQAAHLYKYYQGKFGQVPRLLNRSKDNNDIDIPALLAIDVIGVSKTNFSFVASFQCQILRLSILACEEVDLSSFLNQVRLDKAGSPARNVTVGYESSHIEEEKAGNQLRTISQALIRMYSVAPTAKSLQLAHVKSRFSIFMEALKIRCSSWKLLKHQPQIDQEIWTPFVRAAKKLILTTNDADIALYKHVTESLDYLLNVLTEYGFCSDIPTSHISYFTRLADKCGDDKRALRWLQQSSKSHDVSVWQEAMISWQKASLHYTAEPKITESLEKYFDSALRITKELSNSRASIDDNLLVHIARFRKVCLNIILDGQSALGLIDGSPQSTLQICCIHILKSLLKLSRNNLSDEGLISGHEKDKQRPKVGSVLTSLTKSIEAILESVKCRHIQINLPRKELSELLQECQSCLKDLQQSVVDHADVTLHNFFESLCVQTSNILWQEWLRTTEANNSVTANLEILDRSIAAVSSCSSRAQKAAALGMKWEKRGTAALQIQDYVLAIHSFESAIQYHISIEALQEAVAIALSSPSKIVWSIPKTTRYILGRLLKSHITVSLAHDVCGPQSKNWFFDDGNLSSIERAVLFEAQLPAVVSHVFSLEQSRALVEHVQSILQLCSSPEYHVYRQRFVLQLLQMKSKFPTLPLDTAFETISIDQLCTSVQHAEGHLHLATYSSWLSDSLRVQWAIHCGLLTAVTITQYAKPLCSNLLRMTHQTALELAVDNVDFCVRQLELLLASARITDSVENTLQCMLTLIHVYNISGEVPYSQHITYLCQLGRLYTRLDRMTEAEETFATAETLLSKMKDPKLAKILWALTYANYFVDMKNYNAAQTLLSQAYVDFSSLYPEHCSVSGRQRLDRDGILSSAAMVASRMSFYRHDITHACRFFRQAVKISTGIWQAIEQSQGNSEESTSFLAGDISMQQQSHDTSSTIISQRSTESKSILPAGGAAFWNYVEPHCCSLWHAAQLSMHCGLYQDALYYGEQLQKLTTATNSVPWLLRANSFLAALFAKTGNGKKSVGLTSNLSLDSFAVNLFENYEARLFLIETMIETGQMDRAQQYVACLDQNTAEKFDQSTPATLQALTSGRELKVKKLVRQGPRSQNKQQTPPKSSTGRDHRQTVQTLNRQLLEGRTLSLKVMLQYSNVGDTHEQIGFLRKSIMFGENQDPVWHLAAAQKLLEYGLIKLSSDAVKCVLAESALALPVRSQIHGKNRRVSVVQASTSPVKPKARRPNRPPETGRVKQVPQPVETGEQLLLDANQILSGLGAADFSRLPSDSLHLLRRLRSKLSLLSSATDAPFDMTSLEVVLQELQTKDLIRQREIAITEAEILTKHREQILAWPESPEDTTSGRMDDAVPIMLTEADLADLPSSWSFITLSLAQDHKELLLAKVMADKLPFFLRIPLSRSDLDVQEDREFGFQEAKSELEVIIDKANKSCHDERGQGGKQERQMWFQERQSLDKRLDVWLTNVENIWFGGFRGLMAPTRFAKGIISMFEVAFSKALGNHLPSRQKSFGQSKAKIELHTHVLELFLGLGCPDNQDLDDAVADLLYFVIDILQFNGESNAYDEIDFDALTVEVLDALRICHESLANFKSDTTHHTVLIIDKELELFPWESLSCLRGQSISRMPSFGAVLERIRRIRKQNSQQQGYMISTSQKGVYMLNPSSDLDSTESTFKSLLASNLPNFQSLVRTIPSEAEFESMLHDNELLLYFGHGSGAQYIRGRTIRAMKSCAVTLLMGCSSAKMTQCGKLESYGMPGYYIGGTSGCMAMVGTLWDVTDRDIDRFAMKLMVEWGLIAEDTHVQKALERSSKKDGRTAKSKGKGPTTVKSNPVKVEEKRGKVSLSEAVSRGRDACVLQYLNGAAPVIYGVPVFLE